MAGVLTIEAFNRSLFKLNQEIRKTYNGFNLLYNWQQEGFKLRTYQNVLFNTPTASGKSVLMRAVGADEHINYGRRVVICVPSQELAKEFEDVKENRKRWATGSTKIPKFTISHPLYGEKVQGRINTLKEFLKTAESGIIVVCYQTLIGAFQNLPKKYLQNLCVLIDEAHHSSSMEADEDVFNEGTNQLGKVVQKCFKNEVILRFFTATFYRDDRLSVIPDNIMKETKVYDMKLHEFLQDTQLTEVENIRCDIRFAKGKGDERGGHHHALKGIWNGDPTQKTAIWLSNPNKFNKIYQTEEAIKALGKPVISKTKLKKMGVSDEELEASVGNIIYVVHKGVLKRIGELSIQSVDEYTPDLLRWYRGVPNDRDTRENYFNSIKNESIDACIYLNKGQEGTNWKALERCVIYEQRKLGRATQMIGRILRKWPDKKNVSVHFVLPQMLCKTLNEDAVEKVNDYLNTLWASMIIDNIIDPLLIRAKRETQGDVGSIVADQSEYDKVFALRSDEADFLRSCAETIDQWYEGKKEEGIEPKRNEVSVKFSEVVENQAGKLGLEIDDVERFVRATWQRLVVKKQELKGQNIVIDYQMIMNDDMPVGCAKCFYGSVMTKEFAMEYKQFLDGVRGVCEKSFEEVVEYIRKRSEIKGEKTWFIYYDKYNPEGITKCPWVSFDLPQKDFFDLVWNRKSLLNLDEVVDYIRKFPEIIGSRSWVKHYNEHKPAGINKIPWQTFDLSVKQFFDLILERKPDKTLDEVVEYIRKFPEIIGSISWFKHYDEHKPEGIIKTTWTSFELSAKDFFDLVWPKKKSLSLEEIVEYIRNCEDVYIKRKSGASSWYKHWDKNRPEGIRKYPWIYFDMSSKEFFDIIFKRKKPLNLDEFIEYIRKFPEIIDSKSWFKHYDEHKPEGITKNHWNKFNLSVKQFFDLAWNRKNPLSLEEVIEYIRGYPEIISSGTWWKHYKEHKPEGITKQPWQTFDLSIKQFFDLILERVPDKTLDEVVGYIRGVPEISGETTWYKHYKQYNPEGITKCPWGTFKMSQKEFWDFVLEREPFTHLSLEEVKKYILSCSEITGISSWYKHWDKEKPKGIVKNPWGTMAMSVKEFWDFVLERKDIIHLSLEEVKNYILSHPHIKGNGTWVSHWKKHNPKGINRNCWQKFKMKDKQFWNYIFDRGEKLSLEEVKKYILKNSEIKGQKTWDEHWNEVKPKNIQKKVWRSYNMLQSDFFNYIFDRNPEKLSLDEIKKYILRDPRLVDYKSWYKHWEENTPSGINKQPWITFNMSQKEFWDYILDR